MLSCELIFRCLFWDVFRGLRNVVRSRRADGRRVQEGRRVAGGGRGGGRERPVVGGGRNRASGESCLLLISRK